LATLRVSISFARRFEVAQADEHREQAPKEAGGERRLDMRKVWSGQTIALTQLKSMAAKE